MVFGHNTNVKLGSINFHVQTEDRGEPHALIDTTVYYQGRVLHRRTNNYFDLLPLDDDREQALKLRLDEQHHTVLDEMKSGQLHLAIPRTVEVPSVKAQEETPVPEETLVMENVVPEAHVLGAEEGAATQGSDEPSRSQDSPEATTADVAAKDRTLHVKLENAKSWLAGKRATLRILVLEENGVPVHEARVGVRVAGSAAEPVFEGTTGNTGEVEIAFDMPRIIRPDVVLEIEAKRHGAQGRLRFALRAKPKVPAGR